MKKCMKKVVSTIFAVVVMATLATPVKADNSGVEGFVKRLYQCVLGRTADKNGLNYWMNVMKNDISTGSPSNHPKRSQRARTGAITGSVTV